MLACAAEALEANSTQQQLDSLPQQQPTGSQATTDKHQADSAVNTQSTDADAETGHVSVALIADQQLVRLVLTPSQQQLPGSAEVHVTSQHPEHQPVPNNRLQARAALLAVTDCTAEEEQAPDTRAADKAGNDVEMSAYSPSREARAFLL